MTNQMGDVIAITDTNGEIVGNYEYDAWGAVALSDSDIANINPIRYRGYYYDNETGYYYLQSRYYDASICRFINADSIENINILKNESIGINGFVYCYNNPINYFDIDGNWACEFRNNRLYRVTGSLIMPKYEPNRWNNYSIRTSTNCYAYALNIGVAYPKNYKLQPGTISGKIFYNYYSNKFGANKKIEQIVKATTADLKKLGYRFVSDTSPYRKSGYRVALVLYYKSENNWDYHWYREDSKNSWSHKPGHGYATNLDNSYRKIKNPKTANRGIYNIFVGIYWIGVRL